MPSLIYEHAAKAHRTRSAGAGRVDSRRLVPATRGAGRCRRGGAGAANAVTVGAGDGIHALKGPSMSILRLAVLSLVAAGLIASEV
ncbi:MAG: hypothetical protein ACLFTP_10500, partial [Rhodosalinus sp.]